MEETATTHHADPQIAHPLAGASGFRSLYAVRVILDAGHPGWLER
jgi:hypothetical protein